MNKINISILIFLFIFLFSMNVFCEDDTEYKKESFSISHRLHLSINSSWYKPRGFHWYDELPKTSDHPFNPMLGNNSYFNGTVGYSFNNHWRLEIIGGSWKEDTFNELENDENIQTSGEYLVGDLMDPGEPFGNDQMMDAHHANLNLLLKHYEARICYIFPFHNMRIKPFVGIGGGKGSVRSDYEWMTEGGLPILGIHNDDNFTSANLALGCDYFITRNFAFRFEGSYTWAQKKRTITSSNVFYKQEALGNSLTSLDIDSVVQKFNALNDEINLNGFRIGIGLSIFFR